MQVLELIIVFLRLFPGDWRHFVIYAIGSLENLNTGIFHICIDCICACACIHVYVCTCMPVCVEDRGELWVSSPISIHFSFGTQSLIEPRTFHFRSARDLPMSQALSMAPFSVSVGYLNQHPRPCLYCLCRRSAH